MLKDYKTHTQVIKFTIHLLFFLTSQIIFPQENKSNKYIFSTSVNPEAILLKDFMITYSRKLYQNNYINFTIAYKFPPNKNVMLFHTRTIPISIDPFNYYQRIQFRLGLKKYIINDFYIEPVLLFGKGKFNNGIVYYRHYGGWYFLIDREKTEFEGFLKCGISKILLKRKKYFILDTYLGIGYRIRIFNDNVKKDIKLDFTWNPNNSSNPFSPNTIYPYQIYRSIYSLTFHMGFQVGICRKN